MDAIMLLVCAGFVGFLLGYYILEPLFEMLMSLFD